MSQDIINLWGKICIISLLVILSIAAQPADDDPDNPDQDDKQVAFFAEGIRPLFADDLERLADVPVYTYNLNLTADYQKAILAGSGKIEYINTTPDTLSEIVLRLYPNLESFGGNAIIENLKVDGEWVEPSLDETRSVVGVILPKTLPPDKSVTLEFTYSTTVFFGVRRMYDQYSYLETELALASPLPLLSVYDPTLGWWRGTVHVQGDATYSEVGNFDVTIRAPNYLKLITSGTEVESHLRAGSMEYRYSAPLMRDFAIMASGNYESVSANVGDIHVQVHYLAGERNQQGAEKALGWAVNAVTTFNQTYGAYAYKELDIVETHTSAGGIEYPGLIVVADSLWNPNSQQWFEWVTVHEIGHQWWYAMVGNDQTLYPWIDEALTDYSVAVYELVVNGEAGYQNVINNYTQTYVGYESNNRSDVIGQAPLAYNVDAYLAIVYRKGAVFFHTLSQLMGREVFFQALENYLAEFRFGIATPADLQTAFEDAFGSDLDSVFIRWVGYAN